MNRALTAALVVAAVLLAGCGTTSRPSSGSPAGPLPSGVPIKVMTWAPEAATDASQPDVQAVAHAFAAALNAAGGINDHPLEVLTCDEGDSAGAAERCARRAVDEDVTAVLGSYSMHAAAFFPVLEAARIPYLGGVALTAPDFRSPMSFPLTGGAPVRAAAATVLTAQRGCTRTSLVRGERPEYDAVSELVVDGLARAGQPGPVVLRLPADPAPVNETAARIADSGDCSILISGDRDGQRLLSALPQVGGRVPLVLAGDLRTTRLAQLPTVAGSVQLVSWFPAVDNAVWRRYRTVVAAHDPGVDLAGAVPQNTWAAYEVFARVARTMTTYDSASLVAALSSSPAIDTDGLMPLVSFRTEFPVTGLNRLFNRAATFQVYRGRSTAQARPGFLDVTDALRGTTGQR
ncbi:MAG: ABC transporter substrate-binding protein [Pseudonocardia sp.]